MKIIFLAFIKLYKTFLSPIFVLIFGKGCRFQPTCSTYAYQAIDKHGTMKGTVLAFKRIARCHPLSKGGLDPVPDHA